MHKYIIEGSFPISGKIRANGNKNAALPCITAALLTDEPVILRNIPEIEDVLVLFDILRELGSTVEKIGHHAFKIQTHDIKSSEIPVEMAKKVRASILFAGPLLARTGKAVFPPPGGDVIGRRRLDTHFIALSALGAQVTVDGLFTLEANKLVGKDIFFDEPSVTATENAIMAASMAEGTTVFRNVASEPHVQDLCNMINLMGGDISGIGSNTLTIVGKKKLKGCEFEICADFMEVGSLIGLAAVTHGEIEITHANPQNMINAKLAFNKLGVHWEQDENNIYVPANQPLQIIKDMGNKIPIISNGPWPNFPPDLMSIMVVVATQAEGAVLIHDKMFDSRMFFVDKLISMGAGIILCDPHRVVVTGAGKLNGADLVSPDVRAGMTMVIAALCAQGKSTIQNVYQIERGYENIADRLKALGAKIERVKA